MGYVFTPEEFDARKIPSPENYGHASRMVMQHLAGLNRGGFVEGALINGSTCEGPPETGSDLDVVVITKNHQANEVLGSIGAQVARETFVPVEFVPVHIDLARLGDHGINLHYFLYLEGCRGEVVGTHPAKLLAPAESWENPAEEVRQGTASKLRKLDKGRASSVPRYSREHCDYLERILRQPLWNAIDVLRLRTDGHMPKRDGRPLSKDECIELYEGHYPSADIRGLRRIVALRNNYRGFLRDIVSSERWELSRRCIPQAARRDRWCLSACKGLHDAESSPASRCRLKLHSPSHGFFQAFFIPAPDPRGRRLQIVE